MKTKYDAQTHKGMVRENNEDCFILQSLWNDSYLLCAAIDGMGGYEGGEVAASVARDTIVDYLSHCQKQDNDILEMLEAAVIEANNNIIRHKENDTNLRQMGCVATVGLIDLDKVWLYMAHVGDSRLYLYKGGHLQKLSHDHSLVGYREEIGELTEEEAMAHPNRSLISKSLGHNVIEGLGQDYIDLGIFPLQSGTQLLFCSDGLSDMVTSNEIGAILGQDISVSRKNRQLIDLANEKGGKDNITVVLVELGSGVKKKEKKKKKIKSPRFLSEKRDDSHISMHVNLLALFLAASFCIGLILGYLIQSIL